MWSDTLTEPKHKRTCQRSLVHSRARDAPGNGSLRCSGGVHRLWLTDARGDVPLLKLRELLPSDLRVCDPTPIRAPDLLRAGTVGLENCSDAQDVPDEEVETSFSLLWHRPYARSLLPSRLPRFRVVDGYVSIA
jgi:hypothetical protein